jgi:sugar/nucleoside kinase (ribokinase family)
MPEVVTFGLHIVDVLGRPVTRIPPGQEVELIQEITITVAGTAAATAIDLARLSHSVLTVGAVGEDTLGVFLRDTMTREGIDCTGLRTLTGAQTSATILPIRPDGGRPPLHVIGTSALLDETMVPWEDFGEAAFFHMGGTGLLPGLDGAPTARILEEAKRRGMTTTMDFIPTKDPSFPEQLAQALPFVDYLLPNDSDSLAVTGTSSVDDAIAWFHARGVGCTVITLGGDGVSVCPRGERPIVLPAYEVDVVDTTGCGDAFTAGFVSGLLEGMPVVDAADLGCATGSLLATGLGSQAGLTDRATLDRFARRTRRRAA